MVGRTRKSFNIACDKMDEGCFGRRYVEKRRLTGGADMIAHIIREPSKSFAKSTCALQAERRWTVTGMCNFSSSFSS